MLQIDTLSAVDLPPSDVEAWNLLLDEQDEINTPFLAPELVQLASSLRPGVETAVLRLQDETVGFFPYQRTALRTAEPVLGGLSESHAAVVRQEVVWTGVQILTECELSAWKFHHLPETQTQWRPFHWALRESPLIDLPADFDAYRLERRRAGTGLLEQLLRKTRKLKREIGPLRFELHTTDAAVLNSLFDWKTSQHERTGVLPVMRVPWVRELLVRVAGLRTQRFAGVLSALYAGDRLLAVHLGLQRRGVLHIWFPAFDLEMRAYSPGLILMLEMIRAACDSGIQRIELGKGAERYKASLANRTRYVAEGVASTRRWSNAWGRRWRRTKDWLRSSHLGGPFEAVAGVTRRMRQHRDFR